MREIVSIVRFGCYAAELYIVYDFFRSLYPTRNIFQESWRRYGTLAVLAALLFLSEESDIIIASPIVLLAANLIVAGGIFEGDITQKCLYWALLRIIIGTPEYIYTEMLHIENKVFYGRALMNDVSQLFGVIGAHLVSFVIYVSVKRYLLLKKEKVPYEVLIGYLLTALALLGILYGILYREMNYRDELRGKGMLLLFSVIGAGGLIFLFHICEEYATALAKNKEMTTQIKQLQQMQIQYLNMEAVEEGNREIRHNINHFLLLLGEYARNSENEKILDALKEIEIEVANKDGGQYCSHRMMNCILLAWQEKAKARGITLEVKAEPIFPLNQIGDIDLFSIMGNILDNALEAAQYSEEKRVQVCLSTRNRGYFSVIQVINTYGRKIRIRDGELLTSKAEKGSHGIGLRSVRKTVEKNHGNMDIQYDDHMFSVLLVFQNR